MDRTLKHLRALIVLSVAFGLLAGLSVPTSVGAEGPASSFFGFVFADGGQPIPTKVRAYGAGGVVCGTADVRAMNAQTGFFQIDVVGQDAREGCPQVGGEVTFWLLYGRVDDGVPASMEAPLTFQPGATTMVSLGIPGAPPQGWSGEAPPPGGVAILRWNGPDRMPTSEAVALLGVPVRGAWHYDSASASRLAWVPDAPPWVQTYLEVRTGDVVVVRAR